MDARLERSQSKRIFVLHGSHHLTDHDAHGDGLVAWGFVNELATIGHRVHVATQHFDIKGNIPDGLTIVKIDPAGRNALSRHLAYARLARKEYDRFAAEAPVDIVHQMNPVLRGLSLGMIGCRVPLVLGTFVGAWPPLSALSGRSVSPRTIRKRALSVEKTVVDIVSQAMATSLIIATPFALNRLPLASTMRRRIEHLHHGVDLALFKPDPMPGDPARRPMSVLYVGSIEYKKGVVVLARAFARLSKRIAAARLLLVGDGGEEDFLRRFFAEAGISEKVEWIGRQSRASVAAWMRAADVLCAPSFGEPYGQNLLEAMATAKPIVATTAGGHPYLVDEDGALCVNPGDEDGLLLALETVLLSPERAMAMGRHNRSIAEQRHSWSKVGRDLDSIYDRAILRSSKRPPYRELQRSAPSSSDSIFIVVATKNRPQDFSRLYQSIRSQKTQPQRIVIVDQSDTRYDVPLADDVLHIHDDSIRGLTAARNASFPHTSDSSIVLFLDDDAEFANDVLAHVKDTFAKYDDAIGVQCNVHQPLERETLERPGAGARIWRYWERVFYRGFFDNRLGPLASGSDKLDRVHGCAMAFRTALLATERFDERLVDYSYGEDWDYSRRAVRYGRLYLAREANVTHHESPINRYRQRRLLEQRWRNFLYFYEKYRDDRRPIDSFWRLLWITGESIVWLKKGYGLPFFHRQFTGPR